MEHRRPRREFQEDEYERLMGEEALARQKRAAEAAKVHDCTCDQREKKLMGWGQPGQHHNSKCPLFC